MTNKQDQECAPTQPATEFGARTKDLLLNDVLIEIESIMDSTPPHDESLESKGTGSSLALEARQDLVWPARQKLDLLVGQHRSVLEDALTRVGVVPAPRVWDPFMALYHERATLVQHATPFEWLYWCSVQCSRCKGAVRAAIWKIREVQRTPELPTASDVSWFSLSQLQRDIYDLLRTAKGPLELKEIQGRLSSSQVIHGRTGEKAIAALKAKNVIDHGPGGYFPTRDPIGRPRNVENPIKSAGD